MTTHTLAAAAALHRLSALALSAALLATGLSQASAQPPGRGAKRAEPAGKNVGSEALPEPETPLPVRFAPIGQLTLDTATSPGLLPPSPAAEVLGSAPPLVLSPGIARPWTPQAFCWVGVPMRYARSTGFGSDHDTSRGGPCAETVPHGAGGEAHAPEAVPSP